MDVAVASRSFQRLALVSVVVAACSSESPSSDPERPLPERVIISDPAPTPAQGGGLKRIGAELFVTDTDRDAIWLIDLESKSIIKDWQLADRANPGRTAASPSGQYAAVGTRGTGELLVFSRDDAGEWSMSLSERVCDHLEGLDFVDEEHVVFACLAGRVGEMDITDGTITKSTQLVPDLRDVVVGADGIYVSEFRNAVVHQLDRLLVQQSVLRPDSSDLRRPATMFRIVAHPRGGVLASLQMAASGAERVIDVRNITANPPYGSRALCRVSLMGASLTHLRPDQPPRGGQVIGDFVLPLDVAVYEEGISTKIATIAAGNHNRRNATGKSIIVDEENALLGSPGDSNIRICDAEGQRFDTGGQILSVEFGESGEVIVQTRDPWKVWIDGDDVDLPGVELRDTGYEMYHMDPGGGIACASCHPFGRDDGQTWHFIGNVFEGPRRTPPVFGGVSSTEPFHWSGDIFNFSSLMSEIFSLRMGGAKLPDEYAAALGAYTSGIPALNFSVPVGQESMVARGEELFMDEEVGCFVCHSGTQHTNNQTVDVGTGEPFQVPRLVGLRVRAPFMHNGCADNLYARFRDEECGGGTTHGNVSNLSDADVDALVAFLNTL